MAETAVELVELAVLVVVAVLALAMVVVQVFYSWPSTRVSWPPRAPVSRAPSFLYSSPSLLLQRQEA